jgi:hypothetical protein
MKKGKQQPSGRGANLLERIAVRYLLSRARREGGHVDPQVHLLDATERAELHRIEWGAIARSAYAGALSSIVAAAAETWADTFLVAGESDGMLGHGRYWGFVFGVAVVASVVEIFFLYRDALASVQRMARCAGLPLADLRAEDDLSFIALALARAAMEVPSPPEKLLGIDPFRESSRLRFLLASVLYKAKIALSTVVLKVLVRRVLSRALLRWVLPFVGVPVTALWNALVTYRIMREARLRAMGPSSAREICTRAFASGNDRKTEELFLRAVASCVVRTGELHPNLRHLLLDIHARLGEVTPPNLDDTQEFLRLLEELSPAESARVMELLCYAAIVDGRLTAPEERLIREAGAVAGLPHRLERAKALRQRFLEGEPLEQGEPGRAGQRG